MSIGAAYGVLVGVFQWGHGKALIGVDKNGPIEAWIPMMMFAIVFGLSMDYEVFLLSRIKEHYDKTRDNAVAVADGVAVTARVITAAALIMVCVFLSFVIGDDRSLKMFGLGLAVAVAIDATVVRMLLVPATMELLGRPQLVDPEVDRPDPAQHRRRGAARGRRRRARARSASPSPSPASSRPHRGEFSRAGVRAVDSYRRVRLERRPAHGERTPPTMTLIRVEPESIRRYGHAAQANFDGMHASLVELVNQVVAVRYFGPNAFRFKSEVGRLAADFANRLHLDMQAMAEAVRTSTTNIAAALGGSPIAIRLDPRPITPPAPAVGRLRRRRHRRPRGAGPGRRRPLRVAPAGAELEPSRSCRPPTGRATPSGSWSRRSRRVTASARARCDAAEGAITSFVRSQLESVLAADR